MAAKENEYENVRLYAQQSRITRLLYTLRDMNEFGLVVDFNRLQLVGESGGASASFSIAIGAGQGYSSCDGLWIAKAHISFNLIDLRALVASHRVQIGPCRRAVR